MSQDKKQPATDPVIQDQEERATLKEAVLRPRPVRERAAIVVACALHALRDEDRRQMQVALYALRRAFRFLAGVNASVDPWTWAKERVRPVAPVETSEKSAESAEGQEEKPSLQGDVP